MDEAAYQARYFTHPAPVPRFDIRGIDGVALPVPDLARAHAFYEAVLGPADYVEGDEAHGWRLGSTWLTLLPAAPGTASTASFSIELASSDEAERLQRAFVAAGARARPPSDQLMYRRIRHCPVTDPFGNEIILAAAL